MASQLASGDLVADRYAFAIYDLALKNKAVEVVLKDLEALKKIIKENKELNLLVKSPLIASNDKLEILLKLTKEKSTSEMTTTFLKVISKNKRFASLTSIISQFININAQKRGDVLADITSADELSDKQKDDIKDHLVTILGDKLSLDFKVDKKIIGGLIVKVGSKMIDASLANKINKLKIAMKGA
jgi:F-type H+-transporting ATPase subunit delta